jgi:NADH pyrophosphatase NudC (nudix superfamily)
MASVVGIIMNQHGDILLGKKRKDSPKVLAGCWHIPGETIKDNETALIRGAKEEANLEIVVGKYVCSSIAPPSHTKARWYECFSDTEKITPGSDLEEVKWVSKKEVIKYCKGKAVEFWPKEIINYFG